MKNHTFYTNISTIFPRLYNPLRRLQFYNEQASSGSTRHTFNLSIISIMDIMYSRGISFLFLFYNFYGKISCVPGNQRVISSTEVLQ